MYLTKQKLWGLKNTSLQQTLERQKSFNLQDNAGIMATKSPGLETETI